MYWGSEDKETNGRKLIVVGLGDGGGQLAHFCDHFHNTFSNICLFGESVHFEDIN